MGKTLGFLEYARQAQKERAVSERLKDFDDFHLSPDVIAQREQAARCMACAVPFCTSGMVLGGAPSGCPLGNLIPEWNDLLYHGRIREAAARLMRTNPFPEFTSRVCPALCEGACTCSIHGESVTVRQNEWAIIDAAFEQGLVVPRIPTHLTGKCVAVIGSGPSGLACADRLNQLGHKVTVYEREDRVGGLLMYGIPNMKLDKALIARRVKLLEQEGVTFIPSCEVGKDISAREINAQYDAVVLCCGAQKPRDLDVPGRDAKGVHFAVDYLKVATKSLLDAKHALPDLMNAKGKHVVVIGGGDTGTDCVGTALRQGAVSVTQLEIMPQACAARQTSNPWPQYPRVLKTDYGQAEAAATLGSDPRQYETTTREIIRDASGAVRALDVCGVEWVMADGKRVMRELPGTTRELEAQMVLIAMGFTGPDAQALNAFGVETTQRGYAAEKDYKTSADKVFISGDMRTGQSLVVRALNDGRCAAERVNACL